MGASIGRKVMSGHFLVGAMSRLPIMLGAVSVIAMLATTACVIMAASRWMTFRKMGEPGWKAIVPFCDVYTMLGRVWKRDVFWWLVGGEVALVACEAAAFSLPRGSGLRVVAFAVGVVLLCVVGVMYARLARGFGKPTAFGLGLLLFPVVFFPVLGFGRAA
jgi:hypothetical protein